MKRRIEPLYRKVNTRTHGVTHGHGGDYRHKRNSKKNKTDDHANGSMHRKHRHGYDYTPLFRFLLSRIGQDWDKIHSEVLSRLDREEPIFWMVARSEADKRPFFCYGESSYFSGLYIDDDNHLALVDPDLTVEKMEPSCPCCTHTFNGKRFTQKFQPQE